MQPNALPKSFFVGENIAAPDDDPEFYWRNYVVDASASQSLIGVGSWGHVDRVRWEVTEDLLIARKAYQIADGQDNKGVPQKDPLGRAKADKAYTNYFGKAFFFTAIVKEASGKTDEAKIAWKEYEEFAKANPD